MATDEDFKINMNECLQSWPCHHEVHINGQRTMMNGRAIAERFQRTGQPIPTHFQQYVPAMPTKRDVVTVSPKKIVKKIRRDRAYYTDILDSVKGTDAYMPELKKFLSTSYAWNTYDVQDASSIAERFKRAVESGKYELVISKESLIEFPPELFEFTDLKSLSCSICEKLKVLPTEIGKLVNLESLIIYDCCIKSLPESIGNLTKLKTLALSGNKLTSLPKSLWKLSNLETLSLDDNKLTKISSDIRKLTKLCELDLERNKLTYLPAEIGELTKLEAFGCEYNKLVEIPDEFGNLCNLETLDLGGNLLEDIPDSFAQLENLQLFVGDNPLSKFKGDKNDIEAYFDKIRSTGRRRVGDCDFNCGKLYHIFETIPTGRSIQYTPVFTSEHAEEAFTKGIALLKVDGECSALHKENGKWAFYWRRDNYTPKIGDVIVPLPDGKQLNTYDQGGKEHFYQLLYCSPDFTTGKGKNISNVGKEIYACINRGVEDGHLPDPKDIDSPEWITCELVGRKHQSNMDGVPYDHALVPHCSPFLPEIQINSYEQLCDLVKTECIEGVVYRHPDGTRYKIRFEMVASDTLWTQLKKTKKPTDKRVTTIKPKVLTVNGLI